jgi:hypothetical protein
LPEISVTSICRDLGSRLRAVPHGSCVSPASLPRRRLPNPAAVLRRPPCPAAAAAAAWCDAAAVARLVRVRVRVRVKG